MLELVFHQPHGKCSCMSSKTWLPDRLRMLCRAGVGDGPAQRVFLFSRQLEHRMPLGRWQGGLGWQKAVWMLSRR